MKRILCLILVSITISSAAAFTDDSQYIPRAEAAEKVVRYMFDLSYGGLFPIEMTYCMHETRSMHFTLPDSNEREGIYPLLAEINNAMSWNEFKDITPEHKNAIALNLAKEMGIINGIGNGRFCPDDFVTFEQTVKMLVCALGYSEMANLSGGYPNGYMKVADEIGALKNVKLEMGSFINAQEFEKLLKDFFSLDYYPMKGVLTNMPITAEECVKLYAEGVKSRDARVQYAVFDDELKSQNLHTFEELNWVTGTSSPWCTGYEVEKISDLEFNVTFSYATSTGPFGDTIMKITTGQFGPTYKITAIETIS